jgi:hypothetical protein
LQAPSKLVIDSDDDEPSVETQQTDQHQEPFTPVPDTQMSPPAPITQISLVPNTQISADTQKPKRGRPTLAEQALRLEKGIAIKTIVKKNNKEYAKSDRVTRSRNNL